MKKLFKLGAAGLIFSGFIIYGLLIRSLVKNKRQRRRLALENVQKFSRMFVKILGIDLKVMGAQYLRHDQNYLIISNHLSYLDIILLGSISPSCYITSIEVREMPFLGFLTKLAGCIYIERRSRENLQNEIASIENALRDGFNVVIFPEATSTNGSSVLPFKRPLLAAAIKAQKNLLPICINYNRIDGNTLSLANRDKIFWYGSMKFAKHFFKVLELKKIDAAIDIMPEISSPDATRDTLVNKAYTSIVSHFRAVI